MGILGFQKWLLVNFPSSFRVQGNRSGQTYDHVAFDMNQIIHKAARKADNRASLASSIFRQLDQVLKSCVPRKSVFLAYDGPGPLAKLSTQRKRRNKTKGGHKSDRSAVSPSGSNHASSPIDHLEFTPGVEMVQFILDISEYWAYTRLQNDRKYRDVDIRISGCNVAGEGELKLMDYFRSEHVAPTDSVVVVGGDADIVLQGLATIRIRNFFVYLHHVASPRGKYVNYVISVWELCRSFEQMFPGESYGVRLDFILLCILNGNDYIPKVRGASLNRVWSRYRRMKAGVKKSNLPPFHGECIIDAKNKTLNWPMFHALIKKSGVPVRPVEVEFQQVHGSGPGGESSDAENDNSAIADCKRQDDSRIDDSDSDPGDIILYTGNEDGVWMRELDHLYEVCCEISDSTGNGSKATGPDGVVVFNDTDDAGTPDDEEDADNANGSDFNSKGMDGDWQAQVEEEEFDEDGQHIATLVALYGNSTRLYDTERWLRTVLWTVHMYIDGYCSDYMFEYGKPYGPSCDILAQYIKDRGGNLLKIQAPVSEVPPLLPHQAALAMLPKRAVHMLPGPLQQIVLDPVLSKKIFLPRDAIDIWALVAEVERIPKSAYTRDELPLTFAGHPLLLRRPKVGDFRRRTYNPKVKKPGPSFRSISDDPVIYRSTFTVTTSPPCYPWPYGSVNGMMALPYMKVRGNMLPERHPRTGKNHARTPRASSAPHRR